jgi:hypothetical protein
MSLQQKSSVKESGMYSHVFIYRIAKKNHGALLALQEKLRAIYKKHGMLGSEIYQLNGRSHVFEGFAGFEKSLGTTADEEIWIEVDSYESASEFARIVAKIGEDAAAGPLWGELSQLTSDHPIIMGEFDRLAAI